MSTDVMARLGAALADRYRVERELGAGGMATVYLAHDLRHDRRVALKVLRPELAAVIGAERFLVEIKTTANLQHPHILALYDSGRVDGTVFYVMPFVDGESLRDRLNREKQLPVGDAVRIAVEVAGALDYAHRHGVIHRDIKPENILLHDGRALVADFGIALAASRTDGGTRMTETGMSLGTPQYMSPEQALGERNLDARTDVYALGCVLHEMLAGEPPFSGPTAQAIIARVMSSEPEPVTNLRKTVPAHVAGAILTALAKLPADRFESAKAFAHALANPGFQAAPGAAAVGTMPAGRAWKTAAAALTAVTVVAIGVAGWALRRGGTEPRDIGLPPTAPIRMEDGYRNFAVAHDGSFIVYETKAGESSELWYRSLTGPEVRTIAGSEGAYGTPRISPDDKRVAFASGGQIKVVSVAGGTATVAAKGTDPTGGGWMEDGKILLVDEDGRMLRWIDPDGGASRDVRTPYCILPHPLPGGKRLVCGGGAEKWAGVRPFDQPDRKAWFRRAADVADPGARITGADFRVVDDRYLVYMSIDGTLMGARIRNLDSLTVGRSVALVPGIRRSGYSGAGHFDITAAGTLVYVPGINAEVGRLVRWSSGGQPTPLAIEEALYLRFTPSPDGKRLATVVETAQQQELRIYDLATGAKETVDKGPFLGSASWSPDGQHLVYRRIDFDGREHESLVSRRLNSAEAPRVLIATDTATALQPSTYFTEDSLLLGANWIGHSAVMINPTVAPAKVDTLPIAAYFISISPDRKWIAYAPQGLRGIVVQPFPSFDRRYQIDGQSAEPLWRSAHELVYYTTSAGGASKVQSFSHVMIGTSPDAPIGKPEILFSDARFTDTPGWSHAIMPGGDILYLRAPGENLGYYVRVVPHWVDDMKRAIDEAGK